MVVKIYISGISGNKEVKKRQQRVLMILDSKTIKYEIIDITEPGREDDKDFMQNNSKSNGGTVSDPNPRSPLPPQIFNDEEYCGDYDQFDLANEEDTLEQFLKVEAPPQEVITDTKNVAVNGEVIASESKESTNDIEATEDTKEKSVEANENAIDNDTADKVVKERGRAEKENSPEKESSPVRQKSEEGEQPTDDTEKTAEESEIEPKHQSKESTPAEADVNGAVSSREQSEEKQVANEPQKENPSEAFIQSEQTAASD
ncbi:SH3 domain-binding glutamic acid-rich protein homolog [Bicyclus anynana]|uniref:SH3 domain-binding glutamic acid-rich protein homolog n=1 Tax=Bicyclus anynana TaxID=110368 RepID=A0A6J1NFT7_BICAN|nr:SH3 domain-binding glutamic acid-rich protein homolog [Bicyclus anynana]